MDGRGRALDNIFVERLWRTVKYEDVHLKGYETMPTLLLGLSNYFLFYNGERRHQSLGYTTPDVVYLSATGGGTKIVDRFSRVRGNIEPADELGQHHTLRLDRGSILNQANCVWTMGSTIPRPLRIKDSPAKRGSSDVSRQHNSSNAKFWPPFSDMIFRRST